jgi:hypothetical protein
MSELQLLANKRYLEKLPARYERVVPVLQDQYFEIFSCMLHIPAGLQGESSLDEAL